MTKLLSAITLFVLLFSSCSVLENSAKKGLTDGTYTKKTGDKKEKVYLDVTGDSLQMYPVTARDQTVEVDTLHPVVLETTGEISVLHKSSGSGDDNFEERLLYGVSDKGRSKQRNSS